MTNLWREAAERYEALPYCTLEAFMGSDEARAAIRLLAASKQTLVLGTRVLPRKGVAIRSLSVYFIDGEGLKHRRHITALTEERKNLESDEVVSITTEDLIEGLRYCQEAELFEGQDEYKLVVNITKAINKIAEAAP